MSSDTTVSPANSATQTNDERARDPNDKTPIDAEVSEEVPRKRKRVARVADVTKLEDAAGDVFGAPVNDTHNARRTEAPPPQEDAPKRGRKKKAPEPEAVPTQKHAETAEGMVLLADAVFVGIARNQLGSVLEASNLEMLVKEHLILKPEQVKAMSQPIARGLAEENVDLPWYWQLALAGGAIYAPRVGMVMSILKQAEEAKKAGGAK